MMRDSRTRRFTGPWPGVCGMLLVAGAACSSDTQPLPIRNLDRPSSVAFGCYGDLRINGGDPAAPGSLAVSAQPMAACQAPLDEPLPGQEDLIHPKVFGFVLQGSRGTVAVVDGETQAVLDSDPLTPSKNAIPIGTLPVGLAADQSGCHVVSASAATCDLGSLDVTSALDVDAAARISRIPITNSAGEEMRAKPRSVIGVAQTETVGLACPATPTGPIYIAYPGCNTVAVVDAATGVIQAGIQFAEDGSATVTDGAFTCPSECGVGSTTTDTTPIGGPEPPDAGPLDAGAPDAAPPPDAGPPTNDSLAPRPVGLHRGPDGRLYIASENSSRVAIVELDATTGLPGTITSIQLQGAIGVTALAVSNTVQLGGSTGQGTNTTGPTYLYAVATDRTVRVVDLRNMIECDTQVDPRYLYDEPDISFLHCMPVGGPETPPRRPGATSPGIRMPSEEAPLDIAISRVTPTPPVGDTAPAVLSGTFGFVTTSRGNVYVINVDDDNYPDSEVTADPGRAALPLALAHQFRDSNQARDALATSCGEASTDPLAGGPRVVEAPNRLYSTGRIAEEKLNLTPSMRQVQCTANETSAAVSELASTAPIEIRERAFPDWAGVNQFPQDWTIEWEGLLSLDSFGQDLDGPPVRSAVIGVDGYNVKLNDAAASLCQLGVEQFDSVQLIGCDPTAGNAQCGLGETCFVHPDAPAVVTSGVCMPTEQTEALSTSCRDFLITRRLYSAVSVRGDSLLLIPRKRVLRTTPLDGCESDAQCEQMAEVERTLPDPAHPVALGTLPPPEVDYDWVCRRDSSRAPGPDRCLMACETSAQCEAGHACLAGFCYESTPPGPECVQAVQRYTVRASDAFVVVGTRDGYLHNRIKSETGECVVDPEAHPLQVGRIPLRPPPCEGDDMTSLSPNPCTTTVDQTEEVTPFELEGSTCVAQSDQLRTREGIKAVRFENPAFRTHLVDLETSGDASCNGDGAGELPAFSTVYTGFEINFTIIAGFRPLLVPFPQLPAFPIRITPAPDGRLWVMDEGDNPTGTGRVFTLDPRAGLEAFATTFIQ